MIETIWTVTRQWLTMPVIEAAAIAVMLAIALLSDAIARHYR